jgi:phosphatidylinositol alpha 1,6-mannosyltransferase
MKIAVVTESFLPTINGVTNSVLRILEFFDAYGHEAIVIAPESNSGPDDYLGFKVKRVPSISMKRLIPIAIPKRAIRHFIDGFSPDVIHLASPAILGTYVNNVSKELRIPTLSVYQTDVAGFARHYGVGVGNISIQKAFARIHDKTSRTLAPSKAAAADLEKFGTRNVHIWPRGVDLQRFTPTNRSDSLRKSWGSTQKKIVGYVGRLAREKSLETLSEINGYPNIQLLLIGDGPDRKRLEKRLPSAIFTGMLGGSELARAMASLDLFVHTGMNETFCQSIQESLASGVPVIAPAAGGPLDLVSDGLNGYFFAGNTGRTLRGALSLALESDLTDLEFSARESVMNRDWATINKQLIDHYRAIVSKPLEVFAA